MEINILLENNKHVPNYSIYFDYFIFKSSFFCFLQFCLIMTHTIIIAIIIAAFTTTIIIIVVVIVAVNMIIVITILIYNNHSNHHHFHHNRLRRLVSAGTAVQFSFSFVLMVNFHFQ